MQHNKLFIDVWISIFSISGLKHLTLAHVPREENNAQSGHFFAGKNKEFPAEFA